MREGGEERERRGERVGVGRGREEGGRREGVERGGRRRGGEERG